MKKIAFALLAMTGCSGVMSNTFEKEVYYHKDDRVGVCYAMVGVPGTAGFRFTAVPCDKVETLLQDTAR